MTMPPLRESPITLTDTLRCLCINKDPAIIITYGNPMAGPTQLSPYLAGKKVYFLVGTWWTFLDKGLLNQNYNAYLLMKSVFPEHEYIFLTNDMHENAVLNTFKIPNYFCHHNGFIDEKIFKPLPHANKYLDAVYTARLVSFKRHILAKDIDSWGLLYGYDASDSKKQMQYLQHLRRIMPGMTLMNGDPQLNEYKCLHPQQVNEAYNSAHVGLCLSAIEGGNYATTEYMLCGLPIVSTQNLGGRNFFLDATTSRLVDADPEAIAKAVIALMEQHISPHFIRMQALKKIQKIRHNFIQLINFILEHEGKEPDFDTRFPTIFTNKMFTYPKSAEDFVRQQGLL